MTPETYVRLQTLAHLVSFFSNRLNKYLIAGSMNVYEGRPNRQTEHSPAKDLEALARHAAELLDVYEDILYNADKQHTNQ